MSIIQMRIFQLGIIKKYIYIYILELFEKSEKTTSRCEGVEAGELFLNSLKVKISIMYKGKLGKVYNTL